MLRHAFRQSIPLTGMSTLRLVHPQFSLVPAKALVASQVRYLNLHEYQAKQLMAKQSINVQRFSIAETVEQAQNAAKALKADQIVIKAQIHAGGRGKGEFSSGLKGGVHLTRDPAKVPDLVSEMLGYKLKTHQTTDDGVLVSKVMIAEALDIAKETYFAILMDRESGGPVFVGSPHGGMEIEQVAAEHPSHIHKTPIDIETGPTEQQTLDFAMKLGFQGKAVAEASEQMQKLYELFINVDAVQIEINPFGLTPDNHVVCFDAKISFDDNAMFKHPELQVMRDTTEENPRELEAESCGLSYVGMDGNIGCLVNGAGLALATMDIIKLHGSNPANFLDVGGGVTTKQVTQAFKILAEDKNVKTILVNIFGGIASCLTIAEGMVTALKEGRPKVKVPIVVRLQGNQVKEGKEYLMQSGLKNITLKDDIDEAAIASIELAGQ
ncbi:succinyl-CoA ligase subunit beta, mitochondrial-like protein [Gamsiella multidivaricata]|uniref:succinyl-CoA ligase subunit beta, mitochondrial-like protein n=1 Tax=Gamsiella multidivaricata TaxID=101098 RepID=UPI0022204498|nr:succinyl-CoA ligase subunit beta, mitochondrial-like protein [Gamsiella multidivaricata]KAI7819195.1 succinyl-CoA ligase subunit beta, mitochondrial-like protein [Gamsiella multidivaricata]